MTESAILTIVAMVLGFGLAFAGWSAWRADARLRASHALLASVVDTAYDAYIAMDAEGCIREWNREAERTFGWRRDEVLGRVLADLIIPPQHRAGHREGLQRYLRTGTHRVLNRRIEITALDRSGGEFPVELTIWALHDGSTVRFNAFLHDITERRRAVQHLAAQKTAAAALLAARTIEQAAPGVLQAVCEALQWDVGAIWLPDVAGTELRCAEFWRPPDREFPQFEAITRRTAFVRGIGLPGRVWASGAPLWIKDVTVEPNFPRAQFARSDGLHGAFGFPIFGAGNQVLGVIEFFSREVSAPEEDLLKMMATLGGLLGQFVGRTQAEAELAGRLAELARSNEELERFAYVASHDLQEPLRTIGSYAQLLLRQFGDDKDPKAREYADYMSTAVTHMRDLIDGLLAYSRLGRDLPVSGPADFNAVLASALGNLRHSIDSSGARVSAGALPVVRVDASQFVQVFQNLIGNAIKFRGDAPPAVEISARAADSTWVITVRDRGIGIEPQHFERVFGLFQRLHTQDVYPGSGLGLAICKRIVERHGGRIWVEAAAPGTAFSFTVPAGDP